MGQVQTRVEIPIRPSSHLFAIYKVSSRLISILRPLSKLWGHGFGNSLRSKEIEGDVASAIPLLSVHLTTLYEIWNT